WAPILVTTPSGKMIFVCLICGRRSVAPGECPSNADGKLDVRLVAEIPDEKTCSGIERAINDRIATSLARHLRLDWADNKLLPIEQRACGICHGYGCQACLGKGRYW